MGVRCGWGLVAASPLWVFRDPDLPAHELPIRFMGARREKIRGSLCRKLCSRRTILQRIPCLSTLQLELATQAAPAFPRAAD